MAQAAAKTRPTEFGPLWLLKWVAALLILIKLALVAGAGVFQDEAYYWIWGQHPALSYFDHPPLNAWLQGLAAAIFGWNRFALPAAVSDRFEQVTLLEEVPVSRMGKALNTHRINGGSSFRP